MEEETLPNFDMGIDIEELSTSETPIFEAKKETPPPKTTPGSETNLAKTEEDQKLEVEQSGIDIDFLAKEEVENPDEDDTTPDVKKKLDNKQAPASTEGKEASSQTHNSFSTFTSVLNGAGVFPSLTEEELAEVNTVEQLTDLVAKQVKSNEYKDLTDTQKTYLDSVRNGVSQEDFSKHEGAANQYNLISDEALVGAPEMSEELIKRSFIVKGIDQESASKYAKIAMTNPEEGVAEAIKAKASLIKHERDILTGKIEAAKTIKADKLKKEGEEIQVLRSKINEGAEIFPGVKVNATTKDKIFNSMTTPVGGNDAGDPVNELMQKYQEDIEFRMKLHSVYVLTNGFTSVKKLTSGSKSTANKQLADELAGGTINTSTGNPFRGAETKVVGHTSAAIGKYLKEI